MKDLKSAKAKKVRAVVYLDATTYRRLRKAAVRDLSTVSQKGAKIIFDAFKDVFEGN